MSPSLIRKAYTCSPIAACRVVPESPRWLLVHGQYAKARKILAMIAKGNGTQLPECHLKRPTERHRASMLDLFRGREIRHRTLILIYLW